MLLPMRQTALACILLCALSTCTALSTPNLLIKPSQISPCRGGNLTMQRRQQHRGSSSTNKFRASATRAAAATAASSGSSRKTETKESSSRTGRSRATRKASAAAVATTGTAGEYTGTGMRRSASSTFTARAKTTGNLTGQQIQRWDFKRVDSSIVQITEQVRYSIRAKPAQVVQYSISMPYSTS
eukprot:18102-Heterococcus_DN1.PRE.2